jgi:hypothetical protein
MDRLPSAAHLDMANNAYSVSGVSRQAVAEKELSSYLEYFVATCTGEILY